MADDPEQTLQRSNGGDAWKTRVGVILAVAGSAVGLGNFLRFPGLAAQYGGGAFMIPYFIAFFILGLPIAWVEWSFGRYGGRRGFNATPGIFLAATRSKIASYLGVLGLLIPVTIYFFYINVEAWCLGYAWKYLTGTMPTDPNAAGQYIFHYVGAEANGAVFSRPLESALIFLAISFVLNFTLIYRGLSKGIEMFCLWAMPALLALAVVIVVRVLTLGTPDASMPERNVVNGLGYMWNPGTAEHGFWASLANAEMWLAAAGQIFFSLSVGLGVIITYSSYLKPDDDIALSSVTAASGNGFAEVVLGGLMTIPAAFIFLGVISPETLDSTFQLAFKVLPSVFQHMPGGRIFGFLFFFLLFLAAVTSSLSMLQPAIAFLEEGLGLNRKASVTLLGLITLFGGLYVTYFSKGLMALDTMDFWVANFCIYLLATVMVIIYGWVLGVDRGLQELDEGAEIRVPRLVKFIIKYVAPLYLIVIFGFWVYSEFIGPMISGETAKRLAQIQNNGVVQWTLIVLAVIICFFLLLVGQALRRWNLERAHEEVVE
jgi:SNF family Na+-dependent transporter